MEAQQTGKKNIWLKVLTVIIALLLTLLVSAGTTVIVNKGSTPASATIKNGLSAYELAVENGYSGTVQEWISSLSGKSIPAYRWINPINSQEKGDGFMPAETMDCVKIQNRDFFARPADEVAKDLLGKIICRKMDDGFIMRGRITETEAYFGEESFCYGYGGKNPRNKNVIFYSVGKVCHYADMLMISCHDESDPDNVLIRSVDLHNGPMKAVEALDITEALNKAELTLSDAIWLEDDRAKVEYTASERVNIRSDAKRNFKVTSISFE